MGSGILGENSIGGFVIGSPEPYVLSGTMESPSLTISHGNQGIFSWVGYTHLGTIQAEIATSTDGVNWSAWTGISNGGTLPATPYLKYRFNVTRGNDQYSSPVIEKVSIDYPLEYFTGTWESPVMDLRSIILSGSQITWTANVPSGTSVKVEMRSGKDPNSMGAWQQVTVSGNPFPTDDWYVQSRITLTPNSKKDVTPSANYIRLKATQNGMQGIWYSPTIDATQAIDKASGHVDATVVIPGSSTVEIVSRSSSDNSTWTEWVNALVDGTLQHTPDNYIQIGASLQEDKESFQKTETTQADFKTGTLDNVTADTDGNLTIDVAGYTPDICTGGTALSGGDAGGQPASGAFDNNSGTFWASSQQYTSISGSAYIGYDFGKDVHVRRFAITKASDTTFNLTSVKIQRSADGQTWTDVQTVTLSTATGTETIDVNASQKARYWRLLANANLGTGKAWRVYELEMMEYKTSGVRTTPSMNLSSVGIASSSKISWQQTLPADTTITIETSLDGGTTWQTATNGEEITNVKGTDLTGKSLLVKQTLSTTNIANKPTLHELNISIGASPKLEKMLISFDGQPSATPLANDFTSGGQFYFDTLLDYSVMVNGIDVPRKYDGTDLTTLGGSPPRGWYVAAHKNRLWMAVGSRLYYSDILNIENWPVLNFIDISPNDGDKITGLLALGDYLVISKGRTIWLLTGEGASTFGVRRVHSDRGAYAPRSLITMNGALCFVSDDGIYISDFTQAILISERIKKFWQTLNLRRINQAASWFDDHKLYVSVPSANSMINDTVIVYDTIRKAFTGIYTGWKVACWVYLREGGRIATLFGHSDSTQVSELSSNYNDNGNAIQLSWRSKEFDFRSPETYKRINRMFMEVRPATVDAQFTITFYVDGQQIGSMPVDIPGSPVEVAHTILALASKAGVVGGHKMSIQIDQDVLDNPVGVQVISIEHLIKGVKPNIYT